MTVIIVSNQYFVEVFIRDQIFVIQKSNSLKLRAKKAQD